MKLSAKTLKKIAKKKNSLINLSALLFFVLFSAITIYSLIFNYWYQDRIFPGIYIANVYAGGQTPGKIYQKLNQKTYKFEQTGLTYLLEDKKIKISLFVISPTDPDLGYEIINPQIEQSIQQAIRSGREGPWWKKIYSPITIAIFKKNIPFIFTLDKDKFSTILKEKLQAYEQAPQNAKIVWSQNKFTLEKEQIGRTFNYEGIIKATEQKIKKLDNSPLKIYLSPQRPAVKLAEVKKSTKETLNALSKKKEALTWKINKKKYQKKFSEYRDYIILNKNENGKAVLGLDKDWLEKEIAVIKEEIDKPSQDAKFKIVDGKVKEFQESKDGQFLDISKNISLINKNFAANKLETELAIDIDHAKIQTSDVNNLGISEIIGIGISDFSGSPPNRIHNIKTGAASLHGLLIKPGEEFSLLKALLPIDQSNGYLPELVIKGNETVPEYGGGLCQIGTTAFRAALDSGLPITQRRNHSYRVRYYEPAGTDATIYDPAPDFRFLNDTPGHILIQTKMDEGKLIFEYWGTNDGRQATSTYPRIYNITPPPPTKYIETTDLNPGEIKCTERAHNGADAEFTYIVKFPNGEKKERVFKSHYRPWQEVCLKGVKKISTSTTDIIQNE